MDTPVLRAQILEDFSLRRGEASLTGGAPEDASLARHSLDRAMDHLEEVLRAGLQRGDAAARCGAGQFVLLLPQADYEGRRTACTRLIRSFTHRCPHAPSVPLSSSSPCRPTAETGPATPLP